MIVGGPRVGVAEDLVGLGQLLELGLGVRFLAHIRVKLPRQAAERLLDLCVVCVLGHPKDVVVVALHAVVAVTVTRSPPEAR